MGVGVLGKLEASGGNWPGNPVARGQDEVRGGAKFVFLLALGIILFGPPESQEHSSHHSGRALTPAAHHEQNEFLPLFLSVA